VIFKLDVFKRGAYIRENMVTKNLKIRKKITENLKN
jgi:hypothetical protein